MSIYSSEHIPNKDTLFVRVHKQYIKDGKVTKGGFQNKPTQYDGMSTDWERYSNAEEACQRAKEPIVNAVISLNVGNVREISGQRVVHTPSDGNRAHADVFGDKTVEVRTMFQRMCKMEIEIT